MAYGRKYFLEFGDNKANVWRISVLQDGYSGTVYDVKATGSPLIINWLGGGLYQPIRGSQAVVSFFSETDFYFNDFFDATEFEFIVQIKKNGVLYWEGVQIVENYSEPYIGPPYAISLKFGDGLGILKYIDIADTSGNLPTGRIKLIDLIAHCTSRLPYNLNIYEIINIFGNGVADVATNGFLNTTYIDLQAFRRYNKKNDTIEAWNCNEILRELMHSIGCTMYQSDHKWYITRIEEGENASVNYLEYTINSSTYAATLDSSGTVTIQTPITNTESGITWLLQDANMEISEVFNEIILDYQYDLGEISNTDIIVDNDFTFYSNGFSLERVAWQQFQQI